MLREAVASGIIDAIQSGQMPGSQEKKLNDLVLSPFGAASLETSLSTVVTYMIAPGLMNWSQAIDRMSTAPARIAGIPGGTLAMGAAADITIIDPHD